MSLTYALPKQTQRTILERSFEFHGDTRFNFDNVASGDDSTATISLWFRRGARAAQRYTLFEAESDFNNHTYIEIDATHHINVVFREAGGIQGQKTTTGTYDDSDWHHVHVVIDTTQAVAADRMTIHVDGAVPALSPDTNPGLNQILGGLFEGPSDPSGAATNALGADAANANYWDGVIGDFNLLDGVVSPYTEFGEDSLGSWVWKDYTGIHGALGARLEFADDDDLGKNTAIAA